MWITCTSAATEGAKGHCPIAVCFLTVSQTAGQPCLMRSDAG